MEENPQEKILKKIEELNKDMDNHYKKMRQLRSYSIFLLIMLIVIVISAILEIFVNEKISALRSILSVFLHIWLAGFSLYGLRSALNSDMPQRNKFVLLNAFFIIINIALVLYNINGEDWFIS